VLIRTKNRITGNEMPSQETVYSPGGGLKGRNPNSNSAVCKRSFGRRFIGKFPRRLACASNENEAASRRPFVEGE